MTGETRGTGNQPSVQNNVHRLGIMERQDRALELASLGWTQARIAEQLGYSNKGAVSKAIKAALDRRASPSAERLRELHGERLAKGYATVMAILDEEPPPIVEPEGMDDAAGRRWTDRVVAEVVRDRELKLKAVDRLVRLLERESRLHGSDAPVRTEIAGESGVTVLFSAALQPHLPKE